MVEETDLMDSEALAIALQFFNVVDYGIVLQVPNRRCVPLLRRMIVARLGVSDRSTSDSLHYARKFIRIQGVEANTEGYDLGRLFYIGYRDHREEAEYEKD